METGGNAGIPDRVLALYGQPGYETWELIAKALRLPCRGSAHSLAHGLRKPDAWTLEWLELAEWRLFCFPQAVANLAGLVGREPPTPTIFARAERGRG